MAYNKKNWVSNEVITTEALNNIENGIAALDRETEGLATKDYVNQEINKIDVTNQLTDYAKKSELPTKISQLTNDSGYLTSIPSEYVTETELESKGYLTQHQSLTDYAKKTELHNHSNKSVLDNITSTKITEWNNKSTFSGSYNDLTNKPIIPSIEGLATEDFVKNEIAKIDTSIDIVDSVEGMVDTSKQYVYSKTNTWWKYKKVTIPAGSVLPDVDNAIKWDSTKVVINKRINSSRKEVDAPGCAIFYFTFDDEMKNILNTVDPVWIRMKGCSMYKTSGNNTDTKVVTWSSSGATGITATASSQVLMYEETKDGISSTPYPSASFNHSDNKIAPITASKFGYMNTTVSDNSTNKKSDLYTYAIDGKLALSLIVNFASKTAITEDDLKNVYITFNEPIVSYEEIVTYGWYDTGIEYNPNDDSVVVDLGIRVSELEDRVEELENRPVGGGNPSTETTSSTLPSYWKNRLDDISPKIEKLQKENGMDTLQFLWASDIHSVPGTAPNNTTYIGEIGRYMMDKHNIPFFVVSGDIMSQASHAKEESMWNEYDKLTTMLSPIKNEEFLAIRGNHDGVYGSSMEYNGNAKQYYHSYMGDKALFNAFMRRQTLDSHRRVFGKDGMYFYVEYHNYRIYMLNTHTFGDNSTNEQGQAVYNGFKHDVFGSEQLQWVADTLNTVKENQQVIFVAHAPLNATADKSIFCDMVSAYKNRTTVDKSMTINGTYWGYGVDDTSPYKTSKVTADFTNAKGTICAWFNGHIHKDTISENSYFFPILSITCAGGDLRDEYLKNGTLTREKGTPTETAIDLVTITSDYIYCTRIGSGYDRKYNRLTKEITIDYDSAYIPPEKDSLVKPQGSELYLNQQYSQSGGGLLDKNGYYSIIMPIEANTKYKLSLSNIANLNTNSTTLYTLDANKSNATTINGSKYVYTMSGVTFTNTEKTSATVEFTSDSMSSYAVFVTFLGGTVSEDNLKGITIALEERGKLEVSESEEITSEVTWKENTRLSSSSGDYSAYDNVYASSDINVKNGDVIRIYGFTWDKGYRYVNAYNESTFLINVDITQGSTQSTNYFDVNVSSDNVLEVTIKHDSVTHIRVCCYSITSPTIRVTRNMELDINNLVIPNPTNTADTSIWVNGYRFSSSGLAVQEGTSVSNKIQIKKGDTIKISGVTLRESQDRLCVGFINSAGEDTYAIGYFNNGVIIGDLKLMSYKGYADGVYTFFVENDYTGTINYFRFAMPTPTNFSNVKVIREEGNNVREEGNNVNLFDINSDGYVAWDGSKMYTNWMPYTTAETGSKLSTVYHIKGGTPYKFHFKYPSGTETSLAYCTYANSLANVTSDYSDEVKLFQHDFTDGYGTGFMMQFEFREDCADNLIIQADKPIDNLVIPNATNTTDTSIWVNGYRFSSSGLAVQEGTSVSNKIQIKKGDTIKISGVTLREGQDRLCVNFTRADTGEEGQVFSYFNLGASVGNLKLMSYKGYTDGVYTFFVESEYSGTINHFRFAMPTPTNFSKVKVIREEVNSVK